MNEDRSIPRHIAIIMDGNGRWAKERGLPRREGHRAGAESVRECVEACKQLGVEYLTLYAFSSENWNRPAAEVTALMALLEKFLEEKSSELMKQNVRLKAIGHLDRLPDRTRRKLDKAIERTSGNTSLTLVLALSYGAREEIVEAARSLAADAVAGKIDPAKIDNASFAARLYTAEIPDPDLLVRTSGELRVSNFLLWQISYAEIVIFKKFWPDFRQEDLREAAQEYARRHRRFGGL
ncbi:isoprenyl transferase [Luteolibacter sp. GHJ8]|uniref:Isoprenyl transferase n=1 Tax=Luteolibacter rhizosphaerae TaxID=2989719 RepID=A0ABT3G5C4_9BACT|nr:isoprenyl transferase [Luteolibacter rhizosphaerae]MCW1914684.1 isoprenyl transferase [Luteolibacter rhizosphaerae]